MGTAMPLSTIRNKAGMRKVFMPVTFAVFALNACGGGDDGGPGTPPNPVRTPAAVAVSISSSETMSSFGDTRTLSAVVTDSKQAVISDASVQWTSSAPAAVSVSPLSGLTTTATAVNNGSATITATSGTVTGQASTTVQQRLASLAVTPGTLSLTVGNNGQLAPVARDARGNAIIGVSGFSFLSSNSSVASVTSAGTVGAVAVGSATITASLVRDGITATATSTVNVSANTAPMTATVTMPGNTFSPSSVTIASGGTVTWTFGAVDHNVTFSATGSPANIPTTRNVSVPRTFPNAGSFPYDCTIHSGMVGTVVVN